MNPFFTLDYVGLAFAFVRLLRSMLCDAMPGNERTAIGGNHRELVRIAALVIQIAHDAHFAGAEPHLKVVRLPEAFAQCVVDHRVDAAVRIAGGNLAEVAKQKMNGD